MDQARDLESDQERGLASEMVRDLASEKESGWVQVMKFWCQQKG